MGNVMVQATSSTNVQPSTHDRILCCYTNSSDRLQILRITNIPHWTLEGIVFPQQRYLFSAVTPAVLEIHSSTPSSLPVQQIPCLQLRVKESLPLD
jgi:Domain of unknown function (DUF1830)